MRRLLVSNNITLDGFVSGPNGELDWFVFEGWQDGTEWADYARNMITSVGAVLLGRNTYENFVAYWPTATDNDPVITERINNLPKVVFSRTLDKVEWGRYANARLVKDHAEEEVRRMKEEPGKDLVIYGSATLVSDLMRAGLVDEIQLALQPVILGKGRPHFKDFQERHDFTLVGTKQFKTGAMILSYQPKKK